MIFLEFYFILKLSPLAAEMREKQRGRKLLLGMCKTLTFSLSCIKRQERSIKGVAGVRCGFIFLASVPHSMYDFIFLQKSIYFWIHAFLIKYYLISHVTLALFNIFIG